MKSRNNQEWEWQLTSPQDREGAKFSWSTGVPLFWPYTAKFDQNKVQGVRNIGEDLRIISFQQELNLHPGYIEGQLKHVAGCYWVKLGSWPQLIETLHICSSYAWIEGDGHHTGMTDVMGIQ